MNEEVAGPSEIAPPENFIPVTAFEQEPAAVPSLYEKPKSNKGVVDLGWSYPTTDAFAHNSFTIEIKPLPLGDWEDSGLPARQ